jgi:cytochrome-b5 reductase
LVAIPVPPESLDLFSKDAVRKSGEQASDGEVVVQHIMVKSPDIQIERPYTPINDVSKDGEVRLVVKRVRGGEVGR